MLKSGKLLLKPLSRDELTNISNDEIDKVVPLFDVELIMGDAKSAISKKLEKMQKISRDVDEWYTYWLIIDRDLGKGIGFIGFKGFPDNNGYTEVGYSISANYRKKGLMTEALSLLVSWASMCPSCSGITAKVLQTNIGSRGVMSNCNFRVSSSSGEYLNYIREFIK